MGDFTEVVVEGGGNSAPVRDGSGSAPIVEVAKPDGSVARARGGSRTSEKASGGPFSSTADAMPVEGSGGRQFSESVREKMQAIVAAHRAELRGDDPDDPDEPEAVATESIADGAVAAEEPDADDPDDPEAVEKPAAAPAKAAKAAAVEADERDAIIERQRKANEKLLADLEAARKGADESLAARAKRLEEAEESYIADPVKAIRLFIANALQVEPDSPEVDRELGDFHVDLTSAVAGVTLDPVHRATRESARTRLEWAREKKRREAGEKKQTDEQARAQRTQQVEYATSLIREGLKPQAQKFPSLQLASALGQAPEKLVYELLEKGLKAGDFDPNWSDDKLLDAAATLAENHFKPIAERVRASINPTSTATASAGKPAVAASDKSSTRQSTGARVTNADASVAPATPPAPKPSTPKKPPPISDDEARRKYALRHLRQRR